MAIYRLLIALFGLALCAHVGTEPADEPRPSNVEAPEPAVVDDSASHGSEENTGSGGLDNVNLQTPEDSASPDPEKSNPSSSADSKPSNSKAPNSRFLERLLRRLKMLLFEPTRTPPTQSTKPPAPSSQFCPAVSYKEMMLLAARIDPSASSSRQKEAPKVLCEPLARNDSWRGLIQLFNHTQLIGINLRDKPKAAGKNGSNPKYGRCVMMLVYAPFCPFSKRMAPMYVALARAYPQIAFFAVNIHDYKRVKSAMSAIGVPKLFFLSLGKTVSVYNHSSKSFDSLKSFVRNLTGFKALPNVSLGNASEPDYGPFSFNTEEFDVYLLLSWAFLVGLVANYCLRSSYGQGLKRRLVQLWQEHEHVN